MKSIVLTSVKIDKYKSYETPQSFNVDEKVTVLVGKNESGKTAVLEAIAKTRYFEDDPKFKFDATHDYPRREKKRYDKSGEIAQCVVCTYKISPELLKQIAADVGAATYPNASFTVTTDYNNTAYIGGLTTDVKSFLKHFADKNAIRDKADIDSLLLLISVPKIKEFQASETQAHTQRQAEENAKTTTAGTQPKVLPKRTILDKLPLLEAYLKHGDGAEGWKDVGYYIYHKYLSPNLPKFLYYDEYYALPSRIDIEELNAGRLEKDEQKTSKALFELADINIGELTSTSNFERYIAELEATGNHITDELFRYWKANSQLRVKFQMDRKTIGNTSHNILDIRVENLKHAMSLPLGTRSKGFNWFFSFIVWFNKIQEDKKSNYVLLLDEPGLNLHASAQADLLRFIESLSDRHQIIYTTHSPFMVDANALHRVRTIFDGEQGSTISESIQQRDSDTLFPLQAALGYDIAQNLFISKNNLLVEGPADLIYLTVMSGVLESEKRVGLKDGITIVPVGGLDKVASFISLLKASKLNIACLLDTFTDQAGKQRVEDLIRIKIIKEKNIRFFDEFASVKNEAEIEDMFAKSEYLVFFNTAFPEHKDINASDIKDADKRIVPQITMIIGKDRYNHYRPANHLAKKGVKAADFDSNTLDRFEALFKALNALF
jgi:predicted ATP-dependent endonuclease of OLD family